MDTTSEPEPTALYERHGNVAVITFNRPAAFNAVDARLATAVGAMLFEAGTDRDVRSIVITGAGKAFCAGADLKALGAGESIFAIDHADWGFAGITQQWTSKPLIAAVNGVALGGGLEVVLACDLVVASDRAKLGVPEVRHGLFAAGGGMLRLQRQIPFRRAMFMALTGSSIDAATALDWGLVNVVASPDGVLTKALELASVVAANAPGAVQKSKQLLHQTASHGHLWGFDGEVADAWAVNALAMSEIFSSGEAREGTRAFAEKRAPRWDDA